ncbi:hypothetical protein D6D20_04390 [Aureobasidium pullulans]|uniref:P-loop containing nucleoside triphosphate hydrolase protein n=1 Tax=Aureobasidium pullulans TaxID=5580 RepID=A0A4S8ZBG4_AURPU|nr:hypothetical protein D6D20_04390 [Aureobasidium pullulans]
MKAAYEILGYPTYHWVSMMESPRDLDLWTSALTRKYDDNNNPYTLAEWDALLGHVSAVTDSPINAFAPELIAAYPHAKVVLVERDTESWYKSFEKNVVSSFAAPFTRLVVKVEPGFIGKMGRIGDLLMRGQWDSKGFDEWREKARDGYEEHNALVTKLTFITWRLAIDYRLTSSIPKPNRPNESEYAYFASLCQRYCMILAQRNETGEEMIAIRQQLQEDVFDPALTLGIPADIAELFLFSTRIFIKRCRKNTYMGRWSAKRHTMAVMSRCAVDYNVIITSVVTDPSSACEMMAKCLKLHSYSFRCFLSPKYYTLPDLNMELLPSYMTETPSHWPNVLEILKQAHRTPAESKNDKTLRVDFAEFKQWTPRSSDGIRPGVVLAEDDDKLAKWEDRLPQWAQLHRGLMADPEFSYKDVAPGDGLAPGNLTLKERQEVERKIRTRTLGKSPKDHRSAIKDALCVD